MTPTIKRRIAQEWLILLACIVIGFTATYFAFYFNKRVETGYYDSVPLEEALAAMDPSARKGAKGLIKLDPSWAERFSRIKPVLKYKNPGDRLTNWPKESTARRVSPKGHSSIGR
jgi:hypothetical protein